MEFVDIALDELDPNPDNRSGESPDVSDLVGSIPIIGLLQPIVAVPTEDGRHMVVAGHRRRLALIELGETTAPCVVAPDADAAMQVASRLAENLNRVSVRPTDEARDYQQLALFGWESDQIGRIAGRSKRHVENALTLAKLPQATRDAVDAGSLDLAQAAEAAQFLDDPAAMERIVKRAESPWGARHVIAEEKAKRDKKEAIEQLKAKLVLEGVKVTAKPKGFPWSSREAEAKTLLDADGNYLDPEKVQAQPGFRAFVEQHHDGPRVQVYCTDPEAWGYTRTQHTTHVPETKAQEKADEEAALAARAEAFATATEVRHAFVKQRYGSAKTAKPLLADALRAVIAGARPSYNYAELADAIAGVAIDDAVESAGLDRLTRMVVAQWIARHEANLAGLHGRGYGDEPAAVAYLDQLVADGYSLSEVEQGFYTDLATTIAAEEAERADQAETEAATAAA